MRTVLRLSLAVAWLVSMASCAPDRRCTGSGCACSSDSDCALTGLPDPINSAADCYCHRACDPTPVNMAEFARDQQNWLQFCDNPDAGPVTHCPGVKCSDLVSYKAACQLGSCVRIEN